MSTDANHWFVEIDHGLSWRDPPYYTVYYKGEIVAKGIGDEADAQLAIEKLR